VIGTCAAIEHLLGRHAEAHDRLHCALAKVCDRRSPEAVALMIEIAIDEYYNTDYEQMRICAEQALAKARPLKERPLAASATAVAALAGALVGESLTDSPMPTTPRGVSTRYLTHSSRRAWTRRAISPGPSASSSATRTPSATVSASSRWHARPAKGATCSG
jgi:hypothetical protein